MLSAKKTVYKLTLPVFLLSGVFFITDNILYCAVFHNAAPSIVIAIRCGLAIVCIGLYIAYIARILIRRSAYLYYLRRCISTMQEYHYEDPIAIDGDDSLTALALQLDTLRLKLQEQEQQYKQQEIQKASFFTAISHDLRTPLTALIGYLEMLSDTETGYDKNHTKYVNLCLKQAFYLRAITNTAFEHFYVTEKAIRSTALLRCNSLKTLTGIIKGRAVILTQNGFSYTIHIPARRYALVYDRMLMERLFDNIFLNITRYAEKNTTVVVTASFTKEALSIITENRTDMERNPARGTGIGIKNCKKIMKIHKGTFSIRCKKGIFSVVVRLPLKPETPGNT